MLATAEATQVASGEAAGRSPAPRGGDLLWAIEIVAGLFGRPVGREAVLAGLPVTDGTITPSLFPRAAANAGIVTEPDKRSLSSIPNLVLPAVLFLRDGTALILQHQSPEAGGRGCWNRRPRAAPTARAPDHGARCRL